MNKTNTIYSPHVLILEGIFALHDQRVLDMLDLRIYTEAESDLCLSRRRKFFAIVLIYRLTNSNCKPVIRDVRERGRDIEGCIKQWFGFVKPNFVRNDVSNIQTTC
jgi:uridine kinase